ncbi:MAG: amidohydrolase family protein [Blautia sp.]|nr:amidohydrolase family protein [Blautia sp.]
MNRKCRRPFSTAIAVLLFTSLVIGTGSLSYAGDAEEPTAKEAARVAGWYVSFDEEAEGAPAVLSQGILTMQDGLITAVEDYCEGEEGVVYLDDECLILPGLLDLHTHFGYNGMQLWYSEENESPWDNRFEWRAAQEYMKAISEKDDILSDEWENAYFTENATMGDLVDYFEELQAAAGGTTLIQGKNDRPDTYNSADSHKKLRIVRSTGDEEDVGAEEGVLSITQVFVPDPLLSTEDPSTYLPPIDTSAWGIANAPDKVTGGEYLEELLQDLKDKKDRGYLIHLAEGRAGNLTGSGDDYSRREFEQFKETVRQGIEAGDFTAEDVRNAHIILIHACGIHLDNEDDRQFVKDCGIGIVWSPVSNLILYADTPDFYEYMGEEGLRIAVGSDWSPSGSKNVWDECKFAYAFMQAHASDQEKIPEKLLKAATYDAAAMSGSEKAGNIRPDAYADLFILRGAEPMDGDAEKALELFVNAEDSDVEAVLVNGRPVYGEEKTVNALTEKDSSQVYGQFTTDVEGLENKYFLIPELFAGSTLSDLEHDYRMFLMAAGVTVSGVRGADDPYYETCLQELQAEYAR